ncbi:MAG: RNA 2',3'-cyclic phosphodiesterase [Candidatus Omnitrophica bacterium]|nr:RNA 2',3'-cyclic phosphodiesterase [Candidatus Omnitrophota bacterium]
MADDPLKTTSLRLFLAVPFHDIFPAELDAMLTRFSRLVWDVRWARSAQVHLTLHFFGSVAVNEVARIDQAMRNVALCFRPFPVSLDGIGAFPGLERPSVLWAGVRDPDQRLFPLYEKVRTEVLRLGFPVESRRFQAHITLGRVKKKPANLGPLIESIGQWPMARTGMIDRFCLYQSRCLPEGARYEVLKDYALS